MFWCPVVPASFIERTMLSVLNCLRPLVKAQLTVLVIRVGLSGGSLSRFIDPSRLLYPLCCLDSSIVRRCPVLLFFSVALTSLGLLTYHINFRAGCDSSIGPFGKNHHLEILSLLVHKQCICIHLDFLHQDFVAVYI